MKKNVIVFGLIVGALLTGMMLYSASQCYNNPEFRSNDVLGYAAILASLSLIFVAIKNYRDKYQGGFITFGQAFKVGAYVSLIASTMYLLVWLFDFYLFLPDFAERYADHCMFEARLEGASSDELTKKATEMEQFKEMYKNPLFVIISTLAEVLPLGLLVSLISALFLKRKEKAVA
jgi:hypothetical protein